MARPIQKERLLYLITEDWYFWSHRLNLARAARVAGYEVYVATRVKDYGQAILDEGFQLVPLYHLKREGFKILQELRALFELWRVYKTVRPGLVHHVALKPILYGSLIARLRRIPWAINTFGGMGYIFTHQHWRARLVQYLITRYYKIMNHPRRHVLVVQNQDDFRLWQRATHFDASHLKLVPGSGVDVERFFQTPESQGLPVILCPARLLWDKGIGEFVKAAEIIKQRGIEVRFVLCGSLDPANPAAILESQVQEWQQQGLIDWLGHVTRMETVYTTAHIIVLPSYREGMPKALLEAAACGRAIVTTNVTGCRDLIQHQHNGLVVPEKDAEALARAIIQLIQNPALRTRLAKVAHQDVIAKFSDKVINQAMLDIYRKRN